MFYRLAADVLLVLHLAFIVFVIAGGVAVWRRPHLVLLHLPAAVWGALVTLRGWYCPLTPWENQLRRLGGEAGYETSFIEHYLLPILYPPGLTPGLQLGLGLAVLAINLPVYAFLVWRFLSAARRRG